MVLFRGLINDENEQSSVNVEKPVKSQTRNTCRQRTNNGRSTRSSSQSYSMPLSLDAKLEDYVVSNLPRSVYYIPGFLPPSRCDEILAQISSIPAHKWTNLSHRRLLSLPSPLSGKNRDTLLSSDLPQFLRECIVDEFTRLGVFRNSPHSNPNHVLVNEYLPGQGIMSHQDGPAYYPVTATVSLGGSTVLNISSKAEIESEKKCWRIFQEPGSLLVTAEDCYRETLHGIAELEIDEELNEQGIANWNLLSNTKFVDDQQRREMRTSLTYRDVKKVLTLNLGGKKFLPNQK